MSNAERSVQKWAFTAWALIDLALDRPEMEGADRAAVFGYADDRLGEVSDIASAAADQMAAYLKGDTEARKATRDGPPLSYGTNNRATVHLTTDVRDLPSHRVYGRALCGAHIRIRDSYTGTYTWGRRPPCKRCFREETGS